MIASKLRVGLLGCGRVAARIHLPALLDLADAEVAAIAEPDATSRELARAVAPRASLMADFRELLDGAAIDAAVICLPPEAHAEAALAAYRRGLHVYVEKPLATRLEDGQRVLQAASAAGTVGMVGFNFRYHPLLRAMRRAVADGVVGEPVAIRSEFCAAGRLLPPWKCGRGTGGGALLDLASHQFDLLGFVSGQSIVDVDCMLSSRRTEEDTAVAQLRLSGGLLATVFAALSAVDRHRMEVAGSEGTLSFDRYAASRLEFRPARRAFARGARLRASAAWLARAPRMLKDILGPPREASFAAALAAFVAAAQRGVPAEPGLAAGLDSLAAVLAAERSARDGRRVAVAVPAPST